MEITTSFVFLFAEVDKCLLLVLLPSTMTWLPLLLKNVDGCAADVLKRLRMRRDAVAQVAVVGGFDAQKKLGVWFWCVFSVEGALPFSI